MCCETEREGVTVRSKLRKGHSEAVTGEWEPARHRAGEEHSRAEGARKETGQSGRWGGGATARNE